MKVEVKLVTFTYPVAFTSVTVTTGSCGRTFSGFCQELIMQTKTRPYCFFCRNFRDCLDVLRNFFKNRIVIVVKRFVSAMCGHNWSVCVTKFLVCLFDVK